MQIILKLIFCEQKTAYEMRISDWSSDVCSSDLTGLALTIFGLGLSSLLGAGFVGIPVAPLPKLDLPGISDLPLFGPLLFGHDALVYLSLAAVVAVARFLKESRPGLLLRPVGESAISAHPIASHVIPLP